MVDTFTYFKQRYNVKHIKVDVSDKEDVWGMYRARDGRVIHLRNDAPLGTVLHEIGHMTHWYQHRAKMLPIYTIMLTLTLIQFFLQLPFTAQINHFINSAIISTILTSMFYGYVLQYRYHKTGEKYANNYAWQELSKLSDEGIIETSDYFQQIPSQINHTK